MKKIYLYFIPLLLFSATAFAQVPGKKASLNEDGRIVLTDVTIDISQIPTQRNDTQLEGFPFGRPANPTFKNQRGVTLASILGDETTQILFGADSVLYCIDGSGEVVWRRKTDGTNILPPTVGDMNNNGEMQIAVNNAGMAAFNTEGKVYLLNNQGEDLAGWPVSFDNHWMMNAPVMADLDGDEIMEIVTAERVSSSVGYIHALKTDGTPMEGWPVETTGNVAFTPSVGDVNNDGTLNIVSGISTGGGLYVYDTEGNILEGFPQIPNDASLSYQSVILADITGDGNLEIIGSRHGSEAEYYAVNASGEYVEGWPVASSGWTYSPPAVVDVTGEGDFQIFMGNPNSDISEDPQPMDVIFGFAADGTLLPNFPIAKLGGNEGVITVADVNDDGVLDLIFTSNTFTLEDGKGFVHAFATDGSGELDGFPLRTPGMTYMNSAVLGDINGDGNLDLVTLSYTNTFGQGVDSIFISAFDLGYPYLPENIYFNGYKGSNVRDGLIKSAPAVGLAQKGIKELKIFPNPASQEVFVEVPEHLNAAEVSVFDMTGKKIIDHKVQSTPLVTINTSRLKPGVYFIYAESKSQIYIGKLVIE